MSDHTIMTPAAQYRVAWWQYLLAFLVPIAGIVGGIIALAKSKVGPGLALLTLSAVACVFWFMILVGAAVNDASTASTLKATPSSQVVPGPTATDDTAAADDSTYDDALAAEDSSDDVDDLMTVIEPLVEPTCELNDLMGGGDAGYESFASGFGDGYGGASAREVWDAIMARC